MHFNICDMKVEKDTLQNSSALSAGDMIHAWEDDVASMITSQSKSEKAILCTFGNLNFH